MRYWDSGCSCEYLIQLGASSEDSTRLEISFGRSSNMARLSRSGCIEKSKGPIIHSRTRPRASRRHGVFVLKYLIRGGVDVARFEVQRKAFRKTKGSNWDATFVINYEVEAHKKVQSIVEGEVCLL